MKNESVIIGYSGHAYVVLDLILANQHACKYYCEKEEKEYNPYNLVYGGDEELPEVIQKLSLANAYLGIGNNKVRAGVFMHLKKNSINMPVIAHPFAVISTMAKIEEATVVMPGSLINAFTVIGKAVICNTGSIIEHECILGDFVHIAPGAVLAGNVSVGDYTFIGANATIKQGIKIGKNVIVGAGSVILNDVADNNTVYGNPAKQIVK